MAAATIGESALVFGTTTETWGWIENISEGEEVSVKEVSDNDGDIVAVGMYGKKHPISGTYVFRTNTSSPKAQVGTGTTVTVQDVDANSGAIHITRCTIEKTGGVDPDYKRISFDGFYWPALGV